MPQRLYRDAKKYWRLCCTTCLPAMLLIATITVVSFAGAHSKVQAAQVEQEIEQGLSRSEISLSVGEGKSRWNFPNRGELNSSSFRLAYIYTTDLQWQFGQDSKLGLEWEAGVHHWKDPWLEDDKTGVFINPMWRYYFSAFSQRFYFGAGIGLAYTDSDELMDRKLGSRLLFEDKFEAGIMLSNRHRLSLSLNHYSNANIADINHGVNYYFVNYAYRL